jgi:hypothetical protein
VLTHKQHTVTCEHCPLLHCYTTTLLHCRFVLDHRLQQLMEERGPITRHIEGLEAHIRAMYDELVSEFREKKVRVHSIVTSTVMLVYCGIL